MVDVDILSAKDNRHLCRFHKAFGIAPEIRIFAVWACPAKIIFYVVWLLNFYVSSYVIEMKFL